MRIGLPGAIVAAALTALLPSGGQAADRIKVGFISTLSGPSAALGVDIRDGFQARGQAGRRQARRPAGRGAGRRRPAQARRRPSSSPSRYIKRDKVELHDRHGVLQHHAGRRCRSRSRARRSTSARTPRPRRIAGKELQPVLLRRLVAERRATTRPPGQHANQQRLQERLPHRAELSRPARTRSPASSASTRATSSPRSTPSSASSTTRRSSRRSAPPSPTRSTSSCPAAWASTSSSSSSPRACRRTCRSSCRASAADQDIIRAGRRADARPLRHRALGARLRQRRQPEIRRRVREGVQAPARRCSPRRATTRRC